MTVPNDQQPDQARRAKRARFEEPRPPGRPSATTFIAVALILGAVTIGAAALFARPGAPAPAAASDPIAALRSYPAGSQGLTVTAATAGHDPYPLVQLDAGEVRLPLSTFHDGRAHHYTFMHEGRPLEFFVLKSDDGVVRAAFNACDVCFQERQGYTQDGDVMVCNNCGSRFPAEQINVLRGGCNPSPLERSVSGETLIIQLEDLLTGQDLF